MVGMFLKEREVQYTANKDETTNTWRILDTWHNDLMNLGPDDEIPDDSPAVKILTEGAFIALVKEASRLGVLQNANLGGSNVDEELMDKETEISDLKALLGVQEKKVDIRIPKRTEGYMLKEMAMTNILKIVSIADIETLSEE
jgi:hypothetical protein